MAISSLVLDEDEEGKVSVSSSTPLDDGSALTNGLTNRCFFIADICKHVTEALQC